jgi:hypothetical protein
MSSWFSQPWVELFQTVGIVGSLLFAAYTTRKDEQARRIGNSIAISEQYRQIWKEVYQYPELSRVLIKEIDFEKEPISGREELFVTMLILHLSTVYRAMKNGEFVKLEGLQRDVKEFFSLPIPKEVWGKMKVTQNDDFVAFVESCRN